MGKARITFDDKRVRANIRRFPRELDREVGRVVAAESVWATAWLKGHAPWSDDTGAARAGLAAVAEQLGPGSHELLLSYSVHYGVWLESMESGKYAVLSPGMRIIGAQLMSDLSRIVGKMSAPRR